MISDLLTGIIEPRTHRYIGRHRAPGKLRHVAVVRTASGPRIGTPAPSQ